MFHQCFVAAFTFVFLSFPTAAQVVAKVGSKTITLQDFKKKYDEVKKHAINPPSPELFLEDLVRFEVGLQEAEKQGLRNDPLVKERINQELYKVLIEKAIGKEVSKIKVSEREMKKFYKSNPDVYLAHILIEFKPGASLKERAAAKKHAKDIYKKVKKSKRPFRELVKLYSDDTLSKDNGGNIGRQSKVTLVPPIYNAAVKMKRGEVRGPIRAMHGFHIIKLIKKGSYQDSDKRQVRMSVFNKKRKIIFNKYFDVVKKRYKITTNKHVLKKLK